MFLFLIVSKDLFRHPTHTQQTQSKKNVRKNKSRRESYKNCFTHKHPFTFIAAP